MPRGPEVSSRHMNLYGEAAPPGCMGGMLNMFDWNNALVGGGKKLLADLDFADAGLEAPRNSLDNASGGSGGTGDLTPKSSSATKADIPFGFKLAKQATPGGKELPRANDRRLRGPSVVARLMGLEALPDAPSAAKKAEQQSLPKIQKERVPVAQKFFKDLKMRPHSQSTRDQANIASEFKAQGGGKEAPKKNAEQGIANHKDPGEAAPARDVHPQEKQLQEFKKQFASKLASHSHDNSSSHTSRPPAESFNRDVHVKRVVVQEKMEEMEAREARGAPTSARGEKTDPKHLEAALKKLNKSKELQEFLEVLQSNKEFFLKFLQEPNSDSFDKPQQDNIPEEITFTPPPPIEVKKSKGAGSESKGKSSEKKKKGGISPSAFARRFMESRKEGREQKEKSKSQHGSKSQTETEENTPISTPRTSTSLLPRFRGRSKSKHVIDTETSTTPTNLKEHTSYKVDPYSPGNIVLLRPGSNDSTGISSPVSTLSYSPSLSRSGKEATSKITQKKIEDAARQYQWENGDSTPRSEKSRLSDWDYASPSEPMTTTRNGREPSSSSSITRHMEKHIDSRYERERSKDPKDIARNIIREARASAIELAKFEPPSIAAETLSRVSSSASAGRRIPLLRSRGFDSSGGGDVTGSSDGEITPCSTGRLSTASSRGEFHSQSSSLAGGGLGSSSLPTTVGGTQFSPRAPSQDLTSGRPISADRRTQRFDVQLQLQQQRKEEDTHTPTQHEGGPLRKAVPESSSNNSITAAGNRPGVISRSRSSSTSSQVSSKVLRKAIAGSVLENRLLASSDPHQYATGRLSSSQSSEKGDNSRATTNVTACPSEEDSSVASSPKTLSSSLSLQRCRSVPNAALVRDTRNRGEQQQQQQQQSQGSAGSSSKDGGGHHSVAGTSTSSSTPAEFSHEPSSSSAGDSFMVSGGKQFADSYKRGVEAVGSLFARAKSKERNKIFVRSRKKTPSSASKEAQRVANVSPRNTQLSETLEHIVNAPSSSPSTPAMMTSEDVIAFTKLDPSNSRRTSALASWNLSHSELEEKEAALEVKRVSVGGSDIVVVRSNSERERGSNLGRLSIDKRLPESPSMLTPCMQRVRVNSDMATDKSSSINGDSITITDVLEASAGPQLSRSPKIRTIATDTPRSSKDGETQEIGVDKSGQPSPISVLDSPFEEDSPSPLEFNEISSDLQELRLRLRLLRLDGNERPRLSLDKTHDVNDLGPQLVKRQVTPDNSEESTDGQLGSAGLSSLPPPTPTAADAADVASKRALLESIDVKEIPYPADRKEDLVYVRNLLVASEFVESPSKVITRWHSPTQPLDPILFENLEEYYSHGAHTPQFVIIDGKIRRSRAADLLPRHRVLFDVVNEVLLRKLGPYLSFRPWVRPCKPMLRPIPVGKVLVWDIWMEVCAFFPSSGVDASTFLLTRDLCTEPESAAGGRGNFEEFGLELEETIFNELMDEAVQSLMQTKW